MKEFLLVAVGFVFGAALGVQGDMDIVNKVVGLFK